MKTKIKLPIRSARRGDSDSSRGELRPEWDFSLWFTLLTPLIGFLFGILEGFLLYH
jgi:hypothetical protein